MVLWVDDVGTVEWVLDPVELEEEWLDERDVCVEVLEEV